MQIYNEIAERGLPACIRARVFGRLGDAADPIWLLDWPRQPDLAARLACSTGFSRLPDRSWFDLGRSWLDFGRS